MGAWEEIKKDPWGSLFVGALALSIPTGLVLGLWTENSWWFLLCIPIFIFLS